MQSGYIPPTPDFDFITPRLAVGSRIGSHGLPVLRAKGITHLLAIDSHPPHSDAVQHGITIFAHPFPDDLQEKPLSLLLPIAQDAVSALANPEAVMLVTCGAGMHRAPAVASLILQLMGMSAQESVRLIQSQRYGVGIPIKYADSIAEAVVAWGRGYRPPIYDEGSRSGLNV